MIRYALTCAKDHCFDSWFQSADAFDKLLSSGMITCAICGTDEVKKSIMAPRVRTSEDKPLSAPASPAEQALKGLRAKVEANSEHVGSNFAKEARAMHNGTAPERSIYGEAKLKDAKALIDDGIPVVPLPFGPNRKSN
ncbi:hypothetical protein SAMN05444273_103410 [Litoreibacter ascidiaceicola]|uniref:DUF1178 family protein n=1 Tax=Litoreibacter ascidiaceicola TaxID=1486859 RepID=A0A1M4Y4H1_9RHOB|nr:DUF1178 family protein [Litoreibacter ascidiaceicola]SHF00550.1 hypothetical protein SAMN05444273_103410 [Litoreibacter ascidiaceicola]